MCLSRCLPVVARLALSASVLFPGASAYAAKVEITFDGTIVNTRGTSVTILNLNGLPSGYERMYHSSTPDSPFGLPTALNAPVNTVRSYSLLTLPVTMSFIIDTDLLPTASRLTPEGVTYRSQLSNGAAVTPFTPWMTGRVTINGHTQQYVGDRSSSVSIGDQDPTVPSNAKTYFNLDVQNQIAADAPAGYTFFSRLNMQVQIPVDLLNGVSLGQSVNFSAVTAAQSQYFFGYFSLYDGHRDPAKNWGEWQDVPDLVSDSGHVRVSSMSMRTLSTPPVANVPEPEALALVPGGLLLAGWAGRRRLRLAARLAAH